MATETVKTAKYFTVSEVMDLPEEVQKQFHQQEIHSDIEKDIQLHSDPILPDDIDEHGNLPLLRCGWTKCGKQFESREALIKHVKRCVPRIWIDRFHVNCKNILETDPDLTVSQFEANVRGCYDQAQGEAITDHELIAYYNHFQPLFKQQAVTDKDACHPSVALKETAEILFNYRIQSQKMLMAEHEDESWQCKACSLMNSQIRDHCQACFAQKV